MSVASNEHSLSVVDHSTVHETTTEDDATAPNDPSTGTTAVPAVVTARRFRMDLRPYYSYWYKPSLPEIHLVLDTLFPEENPIVEEGYANYLNSFTIHLNKEISIEPALFARFKRPVCYKASLEEFIDVPLTPLAEYVPRDGRSGGSSNKSDGILLTILKAAVISRETPNEAFDAAFSEFGEVTKPCEFQRDLQHRRFNTNRYLIVKFKEGVRIPDTITVTDPKSKRKIQYRVRHANQTWQCGRCDLTHTGKCPKSQKLKECDEIRKKDTLSNIIIGDSTVRHLEQRAFKADVASMPGGTLGQLTAVALDHPKISSTDTTYIVGGTNDVKISRDEELLDETDRAKIFTYSAQSLFKMIKDTTEGDNAPKIQYVITTPQETDLTPEESVRKEYLVSGLKELANEKETVEVVETDDGIEKTVDGHPTIKGTGDLITSVLGEKDIIIDADVALYSKPYRGIQRMWKAGCKVCRKIGVFDRYEQCQGCLDTLRALNESNSPILDAWVMQYMNLKHARNPPPSSSSSPDHLIPPCTPNADEERSRSPPPTPAKKMRNVTESPRDETQLSSIEDNNNQQDGANINAMET